MVGYTILITIPNQLLIIINTFNSKKKGMAIPSSHFQVPLTGVYLLTHLKHREKIH